MNLRGMRWQIAALFVSMLLFSAVGAYRISTTLQPIPSATPALVTSPSPSPENTPSPSPTLAPSPLPVIQTTPLPTDGIVTYTEALVGTVQRLNPLLAALNPVEEAITSLIFEGLVDVNSYGEPVGKLAETWIVSQDGLEYVFQLKQGILWQDGIGFNADDVLYTIQVMSQADFPVLAQRDFWRTIEIQKLSDYVIRFRLAQPLASFPSLLTFGILPEHALRGSTASQLINHPFNLSPIGTGAYQLEAFRSADGQNLTAVDLRLAPNYQNRTGQGTFALQRLRFRLYPDFNAAVDALKNGTVDGLAARTMDERPLLQGMPNVTVYTQLEPTLGALIYNWDEGDEHRFFADQRIRNALMQGVNYRSLVEMRLLDRAVSADSPMLPNSWAYASQEGLLLTDASRALQTLENANIKVPESEQSPDYRYRFEILTIDKPVFIAIAQEIATQWSQLRLQVTVVAVDEATFWQRLDSGEFDAALVELALNADPDQYAYWHSGQYPDGRNYGGVGDDRISEQLERARRESNGLNRVVLYRQFQQTFISRAIAIPLYYPLYTYAVRSDLEGLQLGFINNSPTDRFRTIAAWHFQ